MTNKQLICVFGGSGFIGRQLVTRLANAGHTVRVPTRNREQCRKLLVIPNVRLSQYDQLDDATLDAQLAGCSVAINLVGILNGSEERFDAVHHRLAARIGAACVRSGTRRLLHMSALNADATEGKSAYLRSKGAGEDAVHSLTELNATSFRPSVVFGLGDSFFNRFAALLKMLPVLPLACPNARFAPVFADDVVSAFIAALDDPTSSGQRYELCGPTIYTLRELVSYTAKLANQKRLIVGLSDRLSNIQAKVFDGLFKRLPGDPPFSVDNYQSLQTDSICGGEAPGLTDLGINASTIESVMPRLVTGHRAGRIRYDSLRRVSRR